MAKENNGDQKLPTKANSLEPPANSINALILQAQSGCEDSLGRLIQEHREYLLFIANQELDLSVRQKIGSSDIVQESMVTAYTHFREFSGTSTPEFKAWIRQILVNDIGNTRRRFKSTQKRRLDLEQPIDQGSMATPNIIDGLETPSTQALNREQEDHLLAALQELKPDEQEVLRQHSWNQKPFTEIGPLMNRSPDAARKLWTRALLKLQSILAKRNVID